MRRSNRPDEADWRSAKERFQEGIAVRGIVSGIVPFGLIVDLPGTLVQGVVLAPGFTHPEAFTRRAESHPVGSEVELTVLGASEGRLQIDLRFPCEGDGCGG